MTEAGAILELDRNDQGRNSLDVEAVRADFPILGREIYGKPLVYLDSGASAQKPRQVLDAVTRFYERDYANVHRGAHYLSGVATDAYEGTRDKIAAFLNAPSREEIVFTRNVTEAINLVANSFGGLLGDGDEVVISAMEHHANIVPWQLLRERTGIVLKVAPITDAGALDLDGFEGLLTDRTRLVSITHCSNVLGTVVPAKEVAAIARARGIPVMFDGAQAIVHGPVDVRAIGCDFYAFTGHKLYGPTGIGVLWARAEHLERMPPWQGGGDMIETVSFEKTTFADPPHRFEAGTPPIAQAVGLGAAIDWVRSLGQERIAAHEAGLRDHAMDELAGIEGLRLIGTVPDKAAIVSFVLDGVHSLDVATILDRQGVAVRVGHHCAEPLMARMGVDSTVRASMAAYNTHAEVEALAAGIRKAKDMLG
jgi:cysteine desulfurase/selenocysteine lyase